MMFLAEYRTNFTVIDSSQYNNDADKQIQEDIHSSDTSDLPDFLSFYGIETKHKPNFKDTAVLNWSVKSVGWNIINFIPAQHFRSTRWLLTLCRMLFDVVLCYWKVVSLKSLSFNVNVHARTVHLVLFVFFLSFKTIQEQTNGNKYFMFI